MRKKFLILTFLIFVIITFSACGDNTDIVDNIIEKEYGQWTYINSVHSTSDNQLVSSISGHKIDNEYYIELSAEWKEIVEITLGYNNNSAEIECSAVSTNIFKDETIDFYCRPIYEKHKIEKITYTDSSKQTIKNRTSNEILIFRSLEYGWKIYNQDNLIIEDTTQTPSITRALKDNSTMNSVEEYILKSYNFEIPIDELLKHSSKDLRYVRNGIYAYCGRDFNDIALKEYYIQFPWYSPTIPADKFNWNIFTTSQQKTIENILKIENNSK